jgi:hypothetical protein
MMIEIGDAYFNLQHVRKVTFTGTRTRLFFSNMGHDFIDVEGDYRDPITHALGGIVAIKQPKRK